MNELNNKQNKPVIPIFFASDDNYVPFLAVSLESLEYYADKNYDYKIVILNSDNISLENKSRLMAEYSKENFDIEFVDVSPYIEKIQSKFHTRDYYSKVIYYRLFIPTMYPEYKKAVYLDCDIVLKDSVSNLYNIDIGENYVGAVPDQSVKHLSEDFQKYVENRVGVDKYDKYFNSGILVMNLDKLREIDFENIFIDLLNAVTFMAAPDQDYLNVICKNHVHFIDEKWNEMPLPVEFERSDKPSLIHYNLSFKPWRLDDIKFEEYFWNFARKTSFILDIINIKNSYTKEMQENTERQTIKLIQLTREQSEDTVENLRIAKVIEEILSKKR